MGIVSQSTRSVLTAVVNPSAYLYSRAIAFSTQHQRQSRIHPSHAPCSGVFPSPHLSPDIAPPQVLANTDDEQAAVPPGPARSRSTAKSTVHAIGTMERGSTTRARMPQRLPYSGWASQPLRVAPIRHSASSVPSPHEVMKPVELMEPMRPERPGFWHGQGFDEAG